MGKKTDPVVPGAADKGETPDPATVETGTTTATGADGTTYDPERAQSTIKAQREEIRQLKAKADADRKAAERAAMSESDKLKAERDEAIARALAAETAATEREKRLEVTRRAAKLGFQDPDDAWGLLDLAEAGDDMDAALGELLRKKPYLARPQTGTSGASGATNGGGNGAGTTPKISAGNPASAGGLTIDQIKAMTPEQVQARRAEVQAVLRGLG